MFEYLDFLYDPLYLTYTKCLRVDLFNILILGRFNNSVELSLAFVFFKFLKFSRLVYFGRYYFQIDYKCDTRTEISCAKILN